MAPSSPQSPSARLPPIGTSESDETMNDYKTTCALGVRAMRETMKASAIDDYFKELRR